VSRVVVDPARPTGLYIKESDASGSPVRYYRRGSAASGMGPEFLDGLPLDGVRIVHVSGITPALSDSCLALMRALHDMPRSWTLSFDLNWRPRLWTDRDPAVLPEPATLVVKQGAEGAVLVDGTSAPVRQPALKVDVVEPVGAGDAFAAGFLYGTLAGWPAEQRLRSGHLRAASALLTHHDVGPSLPEEFVSTMLTASTDEWAAAHVSVP
jgi:2-dehydro-3-deoxygluconokinase